MKLLLLTLASLILIGCGSATNPPTTETQSAAVQSKEHGYADHYSAEKFKALQSSGKRFAIFVGADWCPGCKRLSKEILANQAMLPKDTAILTANFDTDLELRRTYGVATKHTGIFFDESGEHIGNTPRVVMNDFMAHLSNITP